MRGDRDRLRGLDFCPDGWDFCHFCPLGLDFCSDFYPDFCQRLLSKNFSVLSLLSGASRPAPRDATGKKPLPRPNVKLAIARDAS